MPAPILFIALLAATQPAPASTGRIRAFISPMGEPFRTPGVDGLAAWFRQADGNHDNWLSSEEMQQDAQRFYETLDRNKDGEIDPDEVDHYENDVAPEVRAGAINGNDEAAGGSRLGVLTIPEPVTAADSNLDRGISLQEFIVAAQKRFRLLDLNHDGRLTLDELEGARSAVRANARRRPKSEEPDASTLGPPDSSVPQIPGG